MWYAETMATFAPSAPAMSSSKASARKTFIERAACASAPRTWPSSRATRAGRLKAVSTMTTKVSPVAR